MLKKPNKPKKPMVFLIKKTVKKTEPKKPTNPDTCIKYSMSHTE